MTMSPQDNFQGTLLNWIAAQSLDVALILIVLPIMVLAVVGTLVVRAIFGMMISPSSTVGAAKAGAAAEVYAVVLGFIIVFGYSDFQEAKRYVLQEVAALERLTMHAKFLGDGASADITNAVGKYADSVVKHEWAAMSKGGTSAEAQAKMNDLSIVVMNSFGGANTMSQFRLSQLLDKIVEYRVSRLSASPDPLVAGLIFQVLFLGAALAVVSGWFVRGPSPLIHVLLSAMLSGTVVTVMILSAQLLYPFTGPIAISAEPFLELAKLLNR